MSITATPTVRSASIGKSEGRPLAGLQSTTLSLGNAIYRPTSLEDPSKKSPGAYGPSVLGQDPNQPPSSSPLPGPDRQTPPPSPSALPAPPQQPPPGKNPLDRLLKGGFKHVPVVTFAATLLSLILYTLVAVLLWCMSCPWDKNQVGHLFAFCLYAIISSFIMLVINCIYSRYRYNCLSLTTSLLYSGSATLVAYKLILALFQGLCQPRGTSEGSFLTAGHAGNWLVWIAGVAAVGLQVVAHYYYG